MANQETVQKLAADLNSGKVSDPAAITATLKELVRIAAAKEETGDVRAVAVSACGALNRLIYQWFTDDLKTCSGRSYLHEIVVQDFGCAGSVCDLAVRSLLAALQDPRVAIRRAAAEGLQGWGNIAGVRRLLETYHASHVPEYFAKVVQAAAGVLPALASAVEPLLKASKLDSEPEVRKIAEAGLAGLRQQESIKSIRAMCQQMPDWLIPEWITPEIRKSKELRDYVPAAAVFEKCLPVIQAALVKLQALPGGRGHVNELLKDMVLKIKNGRSAQISFSDQATTFENRVRFMEAWAAEGTLPAVTLIVLDSSSPKASKPRLLLRTGAHAEYVKFYNESADEQRLHRLLPGKTWNDLQGSALANFDLPGLRLDSIGPFDNLLSEIEQGLYSVRSIIALDGKPT